jgi:predicted thioesterase
MIEMNQIKAGMTEIIQKRVTESDTSLNYGSGKIENLLATPRIVSLMIEASSMLIDPLLPEGFVSVGKHVEVDHYKATCLGATVTVEVRVDYAASGKVILSMNAYDEHGKIAEGKHSRMIVNYKKLMERANERDMEAKKD